MRETTTVIEGDPCSGPNHMNPNALPIGQRHWVKGYTVSITQQVEGDRSSYMVFCSADCMCDWHGAYAAYAQDRAHLPDFEIPGRFHLVWVTPLSTLSRTYDDWDGLTSQVGEYQTRILKMQEAQEQRAASWQKPYEA